MPRGVYDRTPKADGSEDVVDYGPDDTNIQGTTLAMDQIALQSPDVSQPLTEFADVGVNRKAAVRNVLQDYPGMELVFDESGSVTMKYGQKSESINMTGVPDEKLKAIANRIMQPVPRNQQTKDLPQ